MGIYLTECDRISCVRIEADSFEEADEKLLQLIDEMFLPPGTEVIGELVEELEIGNNG